MNIESKNPQKYLLVIFKINNEYLDGLDNNVRC